MSKYNNKNIKAAALKYNKDENNAPIVVAAGNGFVAQKIINLANECGIGVYHDDSEQTLLSNLELGREIPPHLYQMVVDIYLAVMTCANNSKEDL